VRSAVLVEDESRHLSLVVVRDGSIEDVAVERAGNGSWLVTERPDLSAIVAELSDDDFVRIGTPKKIAAAKEREAFAARVAAAEEAIAARDVNQLVTLMRSKYLVGTRATNLRTQIARALVTKPTPEAADVLFEALRDDAPGVAHIIGFRLYVQKHLASRVPGDPVGYLCYGVRRTGVRSDVIA
jgi:hypothetical protein